MAPANPTSKLLSPSPVVGSASASDIDPTMVTSRPSRIHTVPRPITTSQCQRLQGDRSSRAGMSVVIRPVSTPLDMARSSVLVGELAGDVEHALDQVIQGCLLDVAD